LCFGCLPQWGGILTVLSYFREGALEKGERREYARRETEVSRDTSVLERLGRGEEVDYISLVR
jgi:hypothetical protein